MNYDEILDQLNKLTAQVKDLIEGDVFDDGELTKERVETIDDENYFLYAHQGYCSNVDLLCKVLDSGNGYIFHFPSYSSAEQENYICMDYSEADYVLKLLTYIRKKEQK
jgi:hypothetical protein